MKVSVYKVILILSRVMDSKEKTKKKNKINRNTTIF